VDFTLNATVKKAILREPLTLPAYRAIFRQGTKKGKPFIWKIFIEGVGNIIINDVRDAIIAVMLMSFSMGDVRREDARMQVLFSYSLLDSSLNFHYTYHLGY
jgi:hypothetical protein